MYHAHSTNDESRSNWQSLPEHLIATADRAEQFGQRIGLAKAARLAGLLHDLGKYTLEFQVRLTGAKERVDHSTAGAAIVSRLARGEDGIIAELIAYAIAGHHAGLPDKQGKSFATLSARVKRFSEAPLDQAWKSDIMLDATCLVPKFNWIPIRRNDPEPVKAAARAKAAFQIAFLGRMIFSCLVDAGARIETSTKSERLTRSAVAPLAGARIETSKLNIPGTVSSCGSLRGSADRNSGTRPRPASEPTAT